MTFKKMIAKGCPKCDQQVPVACKACPCGYSFFNAKRTNRMQYPEDNAVASSSNAPSTVDNSGEDFYRRTPRNRRKKPDYYDSLIYDKKNKKRTRNSECDNDDDGKQGSKVRRKKAKKDDEDDDDLITRMNAEDQYQCTLVLAELNRKMQSVTWKPT